MLNYARLERGEGTLVALHREGSGRVLSRVDGLVGVSAPREVVRPRSGSHGSTVRTRHIGDRLVTLEGEVWGSTQAQMYDRLDELTAALQESIASDRRLLFERGGRNLFVTVRLAGSLVPSLGGGGRFVRYQVSLRAADPRAYSQDEHVQLTQDSGGGGGTFPAAFPQTFAAATEDSAACTNRGSLPTPPVIRIYGSITDPKVQLVETGEFLDFPGQTIGPGDYLEVDIAAHTVKLNGTANRLDWLDFATAAWFELPPGLSTVRLFSSSSDATAHAEVRFRNAYA